MRMLKKSSASSVIRPQRGCHREDIAFDRLLQVSGCKQHPLNLSTGVERGLFFQKVASYVRMYGLGGRFALCSSKHSLDSMVDSLSKMDNQKWSDLLHMIDQELNERLLERLCCTTCPKSNRFSPSSKYEDRIQAIANLSEHSNLSPHSNSSAGHGELQLSCDYCDQEEPLITRDYTKQKTSPPELISRQPTIIIGLVGHMKHGKTSLKNSLCGNQVAPGTTEGIGFDNAKIYKCEDKCCTSSTRYIINRCRDKDYGFYGHEECKLKPMMHISFIDCPGHPNLLAATLSAIGIMDAAILVISADESCGQPQTTEHLIALEIRNIQDIIIVQSKVDSVSTKKKRNHLREIEDFIKDTVAKHAVILEKGENYMDMVCETIVKNIHIPPRILEKPPVMIILKSGDDYSKNSNSRRRLVVHGVLLQGMLMPNCEMQISPGIVFQEKGTLKHSPLVVETDLIYAEETQLQFAQPGGIIKLYLTTGCTELVDSLAGHYLGEKGNLPGVFTAFRVSYILLPCILGLRKGVPKVLCKNAKCLEKEEILLVTIQGFSTGARVLSARRKKADLLLTFPVCARKGDTITLCRRVGLSWRLAGKASLIAGVTGQGLR